MDNIEILFVYANEFIEPAIYFKLAQTICDRVMKFLFLTAPTSTLALAVILKSQIWSLNQTTKKITAEVNVSLPFPSHLVDDC